MRVFAKFCSTAGVTVIGICLLGFSTSAVAQGTNIQTETGVGTEATYDQTPQSPTTGLSNPIEMFRGWSQLYKGYDRSPIVFDSMVDGRKRRYPHTSYIQNPAGDEFSAQDQSDMRNMSLKVFNLGVDDEVSKSTMTVYQPLNIVAADFASDNQERDRNLDLFQTVRGTAILTLSYLDKTVAAGLATTQQQVDSHVSNQLLKQLNWTENKLANPERRPLYEDIDEKVEACLKWGSNNAWPQTGRVPFPTTNVCDGRCRDPKYGIPTIMGQNGTYDYCVCCAEVHASINGTYRQGTFNPSDKNVGATNTWSLVDRIFLGTDGPTGGGGTQLQLFRDDMANYREMYGDIILSPCNAYAYQEGGAGAQTDLSTCIAGNGFDASKIEYRLPELSVTDKIKLFRDGLPDPENCGSRSGTGCPLVGTPIRQGICPAVQQILLKWPPSTADANDTTNNPDTLRNLWVQASMGHLLTGDDVNNMFIMMQLEPGELKANANWDQANRTLTGPAWDKAASRFKRYLEVFCDSAAISAFKKYHYRMMSIVEDALRVNQKATDSDKSKMRDLMARVTTQIELAEHDLDSSSVPDRLLAGLDTEADRERVTQMGAAAEAQDAAFWNEQMKNKITLWNWYRSK